jgi:hypothetical protein
MKMNGFTVTISTMIRINRNEIGNIKSAPPSNNKLKNVDIVNMFRNYPVNLKVY